MIKLSVFGNILWVFCGGALLSVMWGIVGILCCCTVIAIPIGIQCFKFASLVLWPFGRNTTYSNQTGSFLLNILWILLFGCELAIALLIVGAIWCLTIVGIPFGIQTFKFARLALLPFGAE